MNSSFSLHIILVCSVSVLILFFFADDDRGQAGEKNTPPCLARRLDRRDVFAPPASAESAELQPDLQSGIMGMVEIGAVHMLCGGRPVLNEAGGLDAMAKPRRLHHLVSDRDPDIEALRDRRFFPVERAHPVLSA